jgi:hypothetical protein
MRIIEEAKQVVDGPRKSDYGPPKESFGKIAKVWSVILGIEVEPRKVGLCLMGLKIVRDSNKAKRDNLRDTVGFCDCLEDVDDNYKKPDQYK